MNSVNAHVRNTADKPVSFSSYGAHRCYSFHKIFFLVLLPAICEFSGVHVGIDLFKSFRLRGSSGCYTCTQPHEDEKKPGGSPPGFQNQSQ